MEDGPSDVIRRLKDMYCGSSNEFVTLEDSMRIMHMAAGLGKLDLLKCLVEEHGCDVNVTTRELVTPLHSAAERGHLEVVKFLCEQGADISCKASNGWTPLIAAKQQGHEEVEEWLLQCLDEKTKKCIIH